MINRIGVVGAGLMGHGIAEAFAIGGKDVAIYETDVGRRAGVKDVIAEELKLLEREGMIPKGSIPEIVARLHVYDDLKKAMADREYVIEAAPEIIDLKRKILADLDAACPKDAILASNTSSLALSEMARDLPVERKKRTIVNHWYNPAHIMPLVEISFFGDTSAETFEAAKALYLGIGKQPAKVLKDIPGLLANRIQQGVAREVFSLIEMGAAEPEDIDRALKFGPAFRYATTGQLEIADFGGLDIWSTVGGNLLAVMDNSRDANRLLKEKVKEGKLGVKTGEGFFKYPPAEKAAITERFMVKLIRQLKASKDYV